MGDNTPAGVKRSMTAVGARSAALLRDAASSGRLLVGSVPVVAVAAVAWWVAGVQAGIGIALMMIAVVMVVPSGAYARSAIPFWPDPHAGGRPAMRILRSLEGAGYTVLHDRAVPRGRLTIDHLVIGPAGVVLVDAKDWRGKTITTDGEGGRVLVGEHSAGRIIIPLTHEAQRVSLALGRELGRRIPVTSLVAVHGARMPRGEVVVDGVTMLHVSRAARWIHRLPKRLAPEEVSRVARSAGRLFPPSDAGAPEAAPAARR